MDKIPINTCSFEEMVALPGIRPVQAGLLMEIREAQGGLTPELFVSSFPSLINAEEMVGAFDFRPAVAEASAAAPSNTCPQHDGAPNGGVSETGSYDGESAQRPTNPKDADATQPYPYECYPPDFAQNSFSPWAKRAPTQHPGTPKGPGRPYASSTPADVGSGNGDHQQPGAARAQARFDFAADSRGTSQSNFRRGFRTKNPSGFSGNMQAPTQVDPQRGHKVPPAAAARQPTLPKSISFDGKGSWPTFYNKFRAFADEYGWSTAQRVNQMYWCLEGRAGDHYTALLNRDKSADFHDLVRKMSKRFDSRDPPEVAQMEFMGARQLPEEGLMEWADRLYQLATRAFPGIPEASFEQQIVLKFCQGCNDKEAGLYTVHMRPESLENAVDSIKLHQRAARAFAARPRKEVRATMVHNIPHEGPDPQVRKVDFKKTAPFQRDDTAKQSSDLDKRVGRVEEQLGSLKVNVDRIARSQEELVKALKGSRPRGRSPSPGLCFKCGKAGHFQKECPEILAGKKVSFISQDDDVEAGNFSGSAEEATLWPEAPAASSWVFQI